MQIIIIIIIRDKLILSTVVLIIRPQLEMGGGHQPRHEHTHSHAHTNTLVCRCAVLAGSHYPKVLRWDSGPCILRGLGFACVCLGYRGLSGQQQRFAKCGSGLGKETCVHGRERGKEREREREREVRKRAREVVFVSCQNLNLFFHMGLQLLPVPSQPLPSAPSSSSLLAIEKLGFKSP